MLFLTAFCNDFSSREIFKPKIRAAVHARVKLIQKNTVVWCKKQQTDDAAGAMHHISMMSPQQKSTTCYFVSPPFPSCFLCLCLKWEEVRCEERGWSIQDVKSWEMRKGGDVGGLAWSLKTSLLRPNYGLTYKLQTDVWTCLHAEESRTRSQSRNKDRKHNDDVIQMLKHITDVGNKVCQHSNEIRLVWSCFFFS